MGRKKQKTETRAMPVVPPWLLTSMQGALKEMSDIEFPIEWIEEKIYPMLEQTMEYYGPTMDAMMATAQRVLAPDFVKSIADAGAIEEFYGAAYAPQVQEQLRGMRKELAGQAAGKGMRPAAYLETLAKSRRSIEADARMKAAQQYMQAELGHAGTQAQMAAQLPQGIAGMLQGITGMANVYTLPQQLQMAKAKNLAAATQGMAGAVTGQVGKTTGAQSGMFGIGGV